MDDAALYFTGPRTVETRPIDVPSPDRGEVRVETQVSAISAGTELLVYRDEAPSDLVADETIDALEGDLAYPTAYGYAAVGEVVDTGHGVDEAWRGRTVFSFVPHQTRFTARPDALVPVPETLEPTAAALLPAVETATNLVLDAHPRLGERVVVFGAGVIGLCAIGLLASFPLERLVVVEPLESRRELALAFGADRAVPPDEIDTVVDDADLAVELSGDPTALDDAIGAVGYDSRVVVGSWYGTKRAPLELGGRYHRDRIDLRSSQVSTIDPTLRGRWDTDRRLETALEWLQRLDVDSLITHRVPFHEADTAYERLDTSPESTLQVLLTYDT